MEKGEGGGGDEEYVKRTGDKGMRQLRGSAMDEARRVEKCGGKGRVLYLIFVTHEMHPAPHVSRSAFRRAGHMRLRIADRCLFGESPFAESISARARVCPLQNSSDYYRVFAK